MLVGKTRHGSVGNRTTLWARTLLRKPLVLFMVIGGAIFLAWQLTRGNEFRVEYSRATQASLAEEFALVTGRPPSAADRAKLERDFVADQLLFREAVARGMHLTDKQTKRRLIDKLRLLVVGPSAEPTEEVLIDHYSSNLALYRSEPQHSVEQVFFATPPAGPASVLATLRSGATIRGDDYWMGHRFPDHGESMLRGIFGQPAVERIRTMPVGEWNGPFVTPRGTHFLRRTASSPPGLMPYAQVRDQVRRDYLSVRDDRAIDERVAELREKYDVQVDR